MSATRLKVVGIGVPSKYFDFPVTSLGIVATVTLKRASLDKPQRTNMLRKIVSRKVRNPIEKAHAAGATPKEIYHIVSRDVRSMLPTSANDNDIPNLPESRAPVPRESCAVANVLPCHP